MSQALLIFLLAATPGVDHPFSEHMRYMQGEWVTENPFMTEENGQPPRYAMRWEMGLGGVSLRGRLWGEWSRDSTAVYWEFVSYWDPVQEKAFLFQESPWGSVGVGEQILEEHGTRVEMTFVNADGSRWGLRDTETEISADSMVTYSQRQAADGSWEEVQAYYWGRRSN